tara:strand:- start:723 stop:1466 length:744 start_codon:yes stop_codon:yes gene_type:complete
MTSAKLYTRAATKHKLLTKAQEQELAAKMSKGCRRSRDKLISCNLRLALSVANKYRNSNVLMEDLIQEANIGLIRAVDRFDYKKGFRFSTYAIWWIRQAVKRYIASQSHVKFPSGSRHLIWKINQARKEYELEFGEMPSDEEVAVLLQLDPKLVSDLRIGMQWPIDIDKPMGDESGARTFGDTLVDDSQPDIEEEIDNKKMLILIRKAFASLKPQEERVLRLRFGITETDEDLSITTTEYNKIKEGK